MPRGRAVKVACPFKRIITLPDIPRGKLIVILGHNRGIPESPPTVRQEEVNLGQNRILSRQKNM